MTTATLATRLRKRMIDRGFNQKTLSVAAKLNETAVRDIFNGRARRPLYTTIIALSDVLGCTPGDLVEGWRASECDELRQALDRLTKACKCVRPLRGDVSMDKVPDVRMAMDFMAAVDQAEAVLAKASSRT